MPKTDTKIDLKRVILPPGKLLIRELAAEEMSPGGIILPEATRGKRCIAVVVKMGKPPAAGSIADGGIHGDLEVGDEISVGKYAMDATPGEEFGEGIHIANESDVLAIVKPEKGKKK